MSGDQKSLSDSIEFGFASWTLRHSCPWTRHTDDVWGSEEPVRRHQHHHPRLRPQHHLHPHRSPLVLLSPKFCHSIFWGGATNMAAIRKWNFCLFADVHFDDLNHFYFVEEVYRALSLALLTWFSFLFASLCILLTKETLNHTLDGFSCCFEFRFLP